MSRAHQRDSDFRTGLIVLLALITVVGSVVFLAGASDVLGSRRSFLIVFDKVNWIETDTRVTMGGYRIGHVTKITRARDGSTNLEVWVEVADSAAIPVDSAFLIVQDGFIGEKYVDIVPGTSRQFVAQGARVVGEPSAGVDVLLSRSNELVGHLNTVSIKLTRLLDEDGIPATVAELSRLVRVLDERSATLIERTNLLLDESRLFINDNRRSLNELLDQATRIGTSVETAVVDNQRLIDKTLEVIRLRTEQFQNDARTLLDEIQRLSGQTTRFFLEHDDELSLVIRNLTSISTNLDDFTRQLKKDPSIVIWGGKEKVADEAEQKKADRTASGTVGRYGKQ
jgi:ABC-type transporter Mla subunit MlaD